MHIAEGDWHIKSTFHITLDKPLYFPTE